MATDEHEQPTIEQQLALCQARLAKVEAKFAEEMEANRETIIQLKTALTKKTEFFAQVNHELRTPLNGMLPMIELILRSELSAETRDYVITLREAGLSLLNIINDVLDFSKIEAGRFEVASVQLDLAETVEGVAQILAPAAASKNILLLSVIDKDLPETVIGDPQKIRQVLLNLCGNAIKFTDAGIVTIKVSTVKAADKPRQLLFTVSDSGPGISQELKSHLFEPFFQGTVANENQTSGTGLGLSISKRLVELMAGKMFVDSTHSVGSTFGFTLPQEELANQEILKVWARPSSELAPSAQEQAKVTALNTNFSALTLEALHDGKFAISDLLKTFDLSTRASDSAQTTHARLAAMASGETADHPAITVVFLDTVRLKDECLRLRSMLENSALLNTVKLVDIVAQDSLVAANKTNQEEKVMTIAMPMKRQAVFRCLNQLTNNEEFRLVTRTEQSTTLGLGTFAQTEARASSHFRGEKKLVLVADDNKLNQRVAYLFLADLGFEVDLAADGIEAVSAFKTKHYDLVLLDCQMPTLDGFEAVKIIKEIQQRRGVAVPVIAVTASSGVASREHCLANGMDDFISKPLDPDDLEKVIANWLGDSFQRDTPVRLTAITNINNSTFACQQTNFTKLRKIYSEKQLKGIISLFRENCKADIAELRAFLAANELTQFRQRLYRFKACCEIIDVAQIAKLCTILAESTKQSDTRVAFEQLEKLSNLVAELDKELESALADRSTYTLPTISNPK